MGFHCIKLNIMRKLESDIKRATKKYERAKEEYEKSCDALRSLVDLKEVKRMDEQGVKPNLVNVMQYGAYLHGIQMACNKIRNDWFTTDNAGKLAKKDDRLVFEAILEKVLESKLDAERWIGGGTSMMFEPVERDKKGNVTKYKASFYIERIVKQKI